jgi:predicted peptidase
MRIFIKAALIGTAGLALIGSDAIPTGFAQMMGGRGFGQMGAPAGPDSRVKMRSYQFEDAKEKMSYALFVSSKVKKQDKSPLIMFLHGFNAGPAAFMHGAMLNLAQNGGYILVGPMGYSKQGAFGAPIVPGPGGMTPADTSVTDALSEKDAMNVLAIIRKEYKVDENRIYLIGFSAGGAGAFHLGVKYASNWTAIAAIAPASFFLRPAMLAPVKDTLPVIMVQGDADTTVPVAHSRRWANAMKEMELNFKYIEVRGATHINVMDTALPEVFTFFKEHIKSAP